MVANQPDLPRVMAKAKKLDVGVVAMKVLRGARLNDMRPFEQGGHTYAQAAFKWALSSDSVDAAIISMTSTEKIDEFLGASGERLVTSEDFKLLEQYENQLGLNKTNVVDMILTCVRKDKKLMLELIRAAIQHRS